MAQGSIEHEGGARVLCEPEATSSTLSLKMYQAVTISMYRYRLRPRVLQDVSVIDTATDILGEKISFPVCLGATSMHKMAHSDGELATARGSLTMLFPSKI